MDYKKIILDLIEFCNWLQGCIDDYNANNYLDETKSDEFNEGIADCLNRVKETLELYGIFFEDADEFDLYQLDNLEED